MKACQQTGDQEMIDRLHLALQRTMAKYAIHLPAEDQIDMLWEGYLAVLATAIGANQHPPPHGVIKVDWGS